jgi:hypothetical protein
MDCCRSISWRSAGAHHWRGDSLIGLREAIPHDATTRSKRISFRHNEELNARDGDFTPGEDPGLVEIGLFGHLVFGKS